MITRIWHGYTTPQNADAYESILRDEGFPAIAAKNIPGFRGIQLLRKDGPEETEFITLMWFDTLEQVKGYAGADYEKAAVLDKAKLVLSRYDSHSRHYEVRLEVR